MLVVGSCGGNGHARPVEKPDGAIGDLGDQLCHQRHRSDTTCKPDPVGRRRQLLQNRGEGSPERTHQTVPREPVEIGSVEPDATDIGVNLAGQPLPGEPAFVTHHVGRGVIEKSRLHEGDQEVVQVVPTPLSLRVVAGQPPLDRVFVNRGSGRP